MEAPLLPFPDLGTTSLSDNFVKTKLDPAKTRTWVVRTGDRPEDRRHPLTLRDSLLFAACQNKNRADRNPERQKSQHACWFQSRTEWREEENSADFLPPTLTPHPVCSPLLHVGGEVVVRASSNNCVITPPVTCSSVAAPAGVELRVWKEKCSIATPTWTELQRT